LQELWKRIVFNMAVSNTDDHLRNHGFLLAKEGWKLSPLFDVNPESAGETLALNVDENSNLIDFELALSVAGRYDISDKKAKEMLDEIKHIVESNWRRLAGEYGINRNSIERMAPAFDMRYK